MDRSFRIAFSVSLGLHLSLFMARFTPVGWFQTRDEPPTLEVIYDYEIAKEEVRELQERLAKATRETFAAPAPRGDVGQPHVRIPDRPLLRLEQMLPELFPDRSAIVDLTDLVEAAKGNPVLLSYFSAIREQIQQAANHRTWMTGEGHEGTVYVSFVLAANGSIRSATVLEGRSVPSRTLQGIAMQIVQSAEPFPAFPPSLPEHRKTIVVPLEFLLGSSVGRN